MNGMFQLILADARKLPLADKSVQCCITSPPYWGLRDYGAADQLGLEQTPEEYVSNMVAVFSEVWRVLRDDGTLWLNLGDSYSASGKGGNPEDSPFLMQRSNVGSQTVVGRGTRKPASGLKRKELVGIPWRMAFALQAAGWYLRQDIIWHKPNPMPESVTDRCTKAHEYIFLLTKSERYYFDAVAIAEDSDPQWQRRYESSFTERPDLAMPDGDIQRTAMQGHREWKPTRNKRSVWTISTSPYKGAHFATYPPNLIEPCVLAGTSEKGCCSKCGAGWLRVVEKNRVATRPGDDTKVTGDSLVDGNRDPERHVTETITTGWKAGCDCGASVVPCTVLDTFNGSGTTGVVSVTNGRKYVGIDVNPEYLKLARQRIHAEFPLASLVDGAA